VNGVDLGGRADADDVVRTQPADRRRSHRMGFSVTTQIRRCLFSYALRPIELLIARSRQDPRASPKPV